MTRRKLHIPAGAELDWYVPVRRYLAALDSLLDLVTGLDPAPDAVVGIKRSGLFPAVYLSHRLELPMFTDSEARSLPYPRLSRPVVVDTAVWSGKSVRRTQARLQRCGVPEVPVAVIWARADPFPEVDGLHYLELNTRIMHFWYEEETDHEE